MIYESTKQSSHNSLFFPSTTEKKTIKISCLTSIFFNILKCQYHSVSAIMWHCIHYISPISCFLQMEIDVCDWLRIIMKAEWYISYSNLSSRFSPFSLLEGYSDLHICCQLDKLAPGKLKGCSSLPRKTQRNWCIGETWRQQKNSQLLWEQMTVYLWS